MDYPAISLGPFILEAVIGVGGMGTVYRARHRPTQATVALKVITAWGVRDPAFRRAFRREIQLLAKLSHPGIIRIFESGEVSPEDARCSNERLRAHSPFLAMEFIEGSSLQSLEVLPQWPQLFEWIQRLLGALAHAHAVGVLHSDIKPSNILVQADPSSACKLIDFGISRELEPSSHADLDGVKLRGTPRYMAPEQVEGRWRDEGPWTDLYGLGCSLWYLLTGAAPFTGKSKAILDAHLHQPVPALNSRIATPEGFESWLRALLQKKPLDRFQRAADAAEALRALGTPSSSVLQVITLPPEPAAQRAEVERDLADDADTIRATISTDPDHSRHSISSISNVVLQRPLTDAPPAEPLKTRYWVLPHLPSQWRESTTHAEPLLGAGLSLYGLRHIPLVGRELERDRMWAALHATHRKKSPHVIALRGPAGHGKSRLAAWLSRRAHEVGASTNLSAMHSRNGGPLDGLGSALSRYLRCAGLNRDDVLERVTERCEALRLSNNDAVIIAELINATASDSKSLGRRAKIRPPQDRYRALRRFFEAQARKRVVVLWLDDAQWGLDTLNFVLHLLNRERDTPCSLLAVLTVQDEELTDLTHSMLRDILKHERCSNIKLGPLPRSEHQALVEQLLGLEPGVAAEVADRTDGNPLFAMQLVGDWVERGVLEPHTHGFTLRRGALAQLPDDIHVVWRERLKRLITRFPAEARDDIRCILELAAALGQTVSTREWETVCQRSGHPVPADLLDRLVESGLVQRSTEGWSFSHNMLRESLERSAQEHHRFALHHRACADTLVVLYPQEDAVTPLRVAARELYENGEYEQAERVLDQREALMTKLSLNPDDHARLQSLWLRGYVLHQKREGAAAEQLADRAIQLASDQRKRKDLGEALRLKGILLRHRREIDACLQHLHDAATHFQAIGDLEGVAQVWFSLGITLHQQGKHAESLHDLKRASSVFQGVERPGQQISTLNVQSLALRHLGHLVEARALAQQAVDLSQQHSFQRLEARSNHTLGEVERYDERWARARACYRRAAHLWELCDAPDAHIAKLDFALIDLTTKHFADAERVFIKLEPKLARASFERALQIATLGRSVCAIARHDRDEALLQLGRFEASRGDPQETDTDVIWLAGIGATLSQVIDPTLSIRFLEHARF